MKVLWLDPGEKTGFSFYDANERQILAAGIIPDGLVGFKHWWHSVGQDYATQADVVGCESFELEEGTHGIDYEHPLSIIHWLQERGIPIVWQRRMQRAKNTAARVEVLKRAGLYPKRGELKEGHQVAALQHLLAYLMRIGHRETIELLHPKES